MDIPKFEDIVRPEELAALREILSIAIKTGADDDNPAQSTMAILASAYTTAASALLMSGVPWDVVEMAVLKDQALTLQMLADRRR